MTSSSSSSSSRLLALTAASTIIYSLYHRYYNRSDSGKKKHDNDDGKLDDDDDWGGKKTKKKKGNNYDNDDKNKIQEQQQQQPILPEHLQREIYKEERRKKSIRFLSMKKPLYDNIEMYHPDNITMLCTIGKKKANWYVKKQLAVWRRDEDAVIVNNENEKNDDDDDVHPSIRLLFEPKNSKNCKINREKIMAATAISTNDDDGNTFERMNTYNINHKKNICVACGIGPDAPSSSSKSKSTVACNNNGKEDHEDHDDGDMEEGDDGGGGGLMRHYVVPYSYRKKFPIKFKTHLPHDIVLLCIECHIGMNQATKIYRTDIYEQSYRTDPNTRLKVIVDEKLKHIKSFSRALHLYKDKLPKQRIQLYENYILKEYVLIDNQNKNDANDIHNNNISNNNNNNNNTDDNNDDDKLDVIIKASNSTVTTTTTTGAMTPTTETVANETKMTTTTTIIPDDTLRQLSENLITEKLNPKYIPLVDLVMKHKLKTDQDVREFVIGWRQFFVDTLNPQYLPIGWSINSPVEIDDNDES